MTIWDWLDKHYVVVGIVAIAALFIIDEQLANYFRVRAYESRQKRSRTKEED